MIKEITIENIETLDLNQKNNLINNPFGKYLVYLFENKIVGFLYYSDIYDRIEINDFLVYDNYKRKGYGSLLLKELIKKNKPISLEVNKNNNAAISLYKKYGFKEVAIRKGYYNGIDGILMVLEKK